MKIKLDENMPAGLVRILAAIGHQADTIPQEGLAGADDTDVWGAAQAAGKFLITQDLDFSDITQFTPGSHHGILILRLKEPGLSASPHASVQRSKERTLRAGADAS